MAAIGLPLSTMVVIAVAEHIVCEDGVAVADGVPDTEMVTSPALGPLYCIFQVSPAGIAGNVTVVNVPTSVLEVMIL